jgi:nicotinate (nicotinamide) nucleotide adenylyltransferase
MNESHRRYVLFGGTFDPWTPAHEEIVRMALEKFKNHHVVVIPTTVTWHRNGKTRLYTPDERIAIIKRRIELNGWDEGDETTARFPVTVYEGEVRFAEKFPGVNRGFIDTLTAFCASESSEASSFDMKFIVGSDEWGIFDRWKSHEDVLRIASPVVVLRKGDKPPENIQAPEGILEIDGKFADISATEIRKLVAPESYHKYCVDPRVWTEDLVPPNLMLHTPIFDVYNIPSDIPGFRPIMVESRDWVCVIVQNKDKEGPSRRVSFRCVRQKRWGTGFEYDEFVTGVVDEGEARFDAALRELEEELGIRVDRADLKILGHLHTNPGFMTNSMFYYYVDLNTAKYDEVDQRLDEHERLEVVDVFKDDIVGSPSGRPALMLAGLTMLASMTAKGEII